MEDNLRENKKSRKGRIALIILIALVVIGAAFATLYAMGVIGGRKVADDKTSDKTVEKNKGDALSEKDKEQAAAGVTDEATLRRLLAAPGSLDILVAGDIEIKSGMPVNGEKTLAGDATIRASYDMLGDELAMLDIAKKSSLTVDRVNLDGGGVAGGVHVGIKAKLNHVSGAITNVATYGVETESETALSEGTVISRVGDIAVHVLKDGDVKIKGGTYRDSSNFLMHVERGGYCTVEGTPLFEDAAVNFIENYGQLAIYGGTFRNCTNSGISNKGRLTMEYRGPARNGMIEMERMGFFFVDSGTSQLLTIKGVHVNGTGSWFVYSINNLSRLDMSDCVLDRGNVPDYRNSKGGGMYLVGRNTIEDVTVKNITDENGNGIPIWLNRLSNNKHYKTTGTLRDITIDNCLGGIRGDACEVDVRRVTMKNFPAGTVKEAFWFTDKTISGTQFPAKVVAKDIHIADGAGRLHRISGKDSTMTITDSVMGKGNYYGLVCDYGATLTLRDTEIRGLTELANDNVVRAASNDSVINLESGVTITGTTKNAAVAANGAKIILNDGAVIEGNSPKSSAVSAVNVNTFYRPEEKKTYYGEFIMNGGEIRDNEIRVNGACGTVRISKDCRMIMNGGKIQNNTNTVGACGGVRIYGGATFEMNGGLIADNISEGGGAGVHMSGIMRLNGGRITGNYSKTFGGGMNIEQDTSIKGPSGVLYMNGGSIDNNHAVKDGGGIIVSRPANVANLTGGSIYGNTTDTVGDGVLARGNVNVSGDFQMKGNSIHLDITSREANNYHIRVEEGLKNHDEDTPLLISVPKNTARLLNGASREVVLCESATAARSVATEVKSGSRAYVLEPEGMKLVLNYRDIDFDTDYPDTEHVDKFEELKEAVESATDDKEVIVDADIEMKDIVTVPDGLIVKIKTSDSYTLSREDGNKKSFFDVTYGTGLSLESDEVGKFILDGTLSDGEKSQPFIDTRGTTEFDGIIFQNNTVPGDAGAIRNSGNLTLRNCEFNGNMCGTESKTNGGAVALNNGAKDPDVSAEITDCVFSGNSTASNCGGALFNGGMKLTVNTTLFKDNKSRSQGGAFYQNNPDADSDFTECIFLTNQAGVTFSEYNYNGDGWGGGAIMLNYGKLLVENCAFEANSSENGDAGGAISVERSEKVEITATNNSDITAGDGKVTETRPVAFKNNTSKPNKNGGGAVAVRPLNGDFGGSDEAKGSTVTVSGYTFTGNNGYDGGAIYCDAPFGYKNDGTVPLTITGCTFDGNSSNRYGGAVTAKTTVDISQCAFTGNECAKGEMSNGGAIAFAEKSGFKPKITDSVFSENLTNNKDRGNCGGAIYNGLMELTVTRCLFTENESKYQGGAVYQNGNGTITLDECIFNANKAGVNAKPNTGQGGSAVMLNTGTLNVKNCSFNDNEVVNGVQGGAVSVQRAKATLIADKDGEITAGTTEGANPTNGTADIGFYRNTANWDNVTLAGGGAVAVRPLNGNMDETDANKGATVTVTGYTFDGNKGHDGGAIYCDAPFGYKNDGTVPLTVTGCTFKGNSSHSTGGAIGSKSATVISQCDFNGNESAKVGNSHGGAIAFWEKTGIESRITNCVFEDNKTTKNCGGAIYNGSVKLTVTGCLFTGNTSKYQAGAVYQNSVDAVTTLDKCIFKENRAGVGSHLGAGQGGSAVMENYGTFNIKNCSFTDNVVENGVQGGAVSVQSATATLTADGDGEITAGITEGKNQKTETAKIGFYNNSASYGNVGDAADKKTGGGAISVRPHDAKMDETDPNKRGATVTVSGYTFEQNTAYDGGAIYCDAPIGYKDVGIPLTLKGCTFNKNTSSRMGGAVNVKSAVDISQCAFTGNECAKGEMSNGGAIAFAEKSGFNPKITDSVFSENLTNNKDRGNCGGAIYNGSMELTVTRCLFTGNESKYQGGAVYQNGNGTITLDECIFNANKAGVTANQGSGQGGSAVMLVNGTLNVKNCSFNDNEVVNGVQGGAVSVQRAKATLTVDKEDKVSEITAGTTEGANPTNAKAKIGFYRNIANWDNVTAAGGGAVAVRPLNGKMDESEANKGATVTVTGYTFDGNQGRDGGAIYCDAPFGYKNDGTVPLTLTDCTFNLNESYSAGGAVCTRSSTAVSRCTFTDNECAISKAQANGGAIFANGGVDKQVTISDSTFTGNHSETNCGGAICNNGVTLTITDSDFEKNHSFGQGAGIYQNAECVTNITGGAFRNNTTDCHLFGGAAIMVNNGPTDKDCLTVTDTVFEGNIQRAHDDWLYLDDTVTNGGGAVYLNGAGKNLTATFTATKEGIKFSNNETETGDGGAIYLLNMGKVTVTGYGFENNACKSVDVFKGNKGNPDKTAKVRIGGNGGAIYSNTANQLIVSGCSFTANKAEFDGGAICAKNLTLQKNRDVLVSFTGNTAKNGTAIAIMQGGTITGDDAAVRTLGPEQTVYKAGAPAKAAKKTPVKAAKTKKK